MNEQVTVVSISGDLLPSAQERKLLPVTETESFRVMAQGELPLSAGESVTIPRTVEHGDLVGEDATLLVIEGTQ